MSRHPRCARCGGRHQPAKACQWDSREPSPHERSLLEQVEPEPVIFEAERVIERWMRGDE